MPPASALLASLRQANLLATEQMHEAERLAVTLPSAEVLAAALAQRGWLTGFQADELSAGRGAGLVIGSYVLLERLGKGGMGEVFRARHSVMEREVALKRVKEDLLDSPELVARFLREVKATAKLSHPNVVQVFDAGEAGGVHFLAMELLDGVNLAGYLRRKGPLPVAEAIDFVRQACEGMQHAHERGLVHRDLKPANLMLCGKRQVKILDLGLALVTRARPMTRTGGSFGTVDYVAPEQVKDSHNVDVRADVYSLGCTLYHLLAGKTPFADALPAARPAMHLSQEPPPVERRLDVPHEVAVVVRKMMAKRREDRYQTPGEAAQALAVLLRGNSPVAQLPSTDAFAPVSPPAGASPAALGASTRRRPGNGAAGLRAGLIAGATLLVLTGVSALVVPPWLSSGKGSGDRADEQKTADDKGKASSDKDRRTLEAPKGVEGGPLNEKRENSIGMTFQLIPKGKFFMGSPEDDQDATSAEMPQHEVEITKDFYLGTYELTQKQYRTIMGYNPSYFSEDGTASAKGTYPGYSKPAGGKDKVEGMDTDGFPVENVGWDDAQDFLKTLNDREKGTLAGWEYRLPTEAEWEYACRAGAVGKRFHTGDTLSALQANFSDTKLGRTEKVGSYPANKFGLYDMHGNVWEWCHDWFAKDYDKSSLTADPLGPANGVYRVERGGGWRDPFKFCRCANRGVTAWFRNNAKGFRVALVPPR